MWRRKHVWPAEDPPPVVDKGDDPCACMSCMG